MPDAPSFVVIRNPVAGRGSPSWYMLEKELRARDSHIRIWATEKAGDAVLLTRRALDMGAQNIIAAGGDGTLGEVAGVIINSGIKVNLGVLPLGTGNDFARSLGLFGDQTRALEAIFGGKTRQLDSGIARCEGGKKIFVNVAGCGFDALVARRINDWRHHKMLSHARGSFAYLLAVVRELVDFSATELTLEIDGEATKKRALLCAIANAQSYGGGMRVCPNARLDDGFFDLCTITEAGRTEFLRAFPSVFAGKHTTHPKVEMARARRVKISASKPLPVLADGEIIGQTPLDCELLPQALSFLVAPNADKMRGRR